MSDEKKTTTKQPEQRDAKNIIRSLQGEDGYEIFSDRHTNDNDRDRWHREYEDNRR